MQADGYLAAAPARPSYQKAETLLLVDHVHLRYGDKVILNDVCAEVKNITRPDCVQGQVVCFLGPSGIGKTQLSRVIAGLQAPTKGRVLVDGRPVARGAVGMVAQTYPLFKFTTVLNNLLIAGRQVHQSDQAVAQRAAKLILEFGLVAHANMYPRDLSGGTRQRVAIARQLMCAGNFIVLDEPFSGLDPNMKSRACALITQVANLDERNTIIVVTHDVTEGLSIADTVWLMGKAPGGGASIVQQYDLAAEDLCWHQDILQDVRFQQLVADVKARFKTLV
jgi:ABC-type nitrate/sulfonate/bicarbonate transport system ATPase subunit